MPESDTPTMPSKFASAVFQASDLIFSSGFITRWSQEMISIKINTQNYRFTSHLEIASFKFRGFDVFHLYKCNLKNLKTIPFNPECSIYLAYSAQKIPSLSFNFLGF